MTEVVKPGLPWKAETTCKTCEAVLIVYEEDLRCGMFKQDPNTYWFDGSATAVDKCYFVCPECKYDLQFIKPRPDVAGRVHKERHDG